MEKTKSTDSNGKNHIFEYPLTPDECYSSELFESCKPRLQPGMLHGKVLITGTKGEFDNKIFDLFNMPIPGCNPSNDMPLYDLLKKSSKIYTVQGPNLVLVKSKWKIVNWWRHITKTEKYEHELLWTWEVKTN